MSYKHFLLLIGILLLVNYLCLMFFKGKAKVFVKKTNLYTLIGGLIFALAGLTGLLLRQPAAVQAPSLAVSLQIVFLGLGMLHAWLLFKILPWTNPRAMKLELLYTCFFIFTACLFFFVSFSFFEKAPKTGEGSFADNFAWSFLLFPVPLISAYFYRAWEAIPKQEVRAWRLPIGQPLPPMLPGNSIRLTLLVTENFQSPEVVKLETLAPMERTLGEVFYYLLYRYNIEKRTVKKIEIAENSSKEKVYDWQFFKMVKRWWWMGKKYYKPDIPLSRLGIQAGDFIIAGRVRTW